MGTAVEPAQAHAERRTLFLRQFHEPGFRDMLARLIDRTERRIQSLSWMQVASGPAPAGKEAADMVHDVVAKALSDDDESGPADGVLLEDWLWDRVSSKVSNFVRSYENRKRSRNYEPGRHPIYDDGDAVPRDERTAMREVANLEMEAIADDVVARFARFVADDSQVVALLECLRADIRKREEIAEYLEVTPIEVTNIGKRLKRRTEQFAAKNVESNPFKD